MTERHTKRQKISSQVDPAKVGELEAFLFGAQPAELAQPFADVVHQDGVEGAVWEDRQGSSGTAAVAGQAEKQPAWEDADDATVEVNVASRNRLRKLRQSEEEVALAGVEYEQRLRCQHVKMHPRTSWASRDADQQPATLLTGTAPLLGRSTVLAPGLLETTRVKDANQHEPSKSVVRSVEFHSAGQLLLTAGLDKQLRIFQVDGVHNTKVQTVAFEDMPIAKAAFANGGSQVVAAGRRKYVYLVDLESSRVERVAGLVGHAAVSLESFVTCSSAANPLVAFLGAEGHVPLLSLRSRQTVGSLKMNGTVRSAAFSADGCELLTSGGDGVVHIWDMRMQRCLQRHVDEGCLNGISLACSADGRLYASGSDSGVVNVYKRAAQAPAAAVSCARRPLPALPARPQRSFMNITTAVDSLAFNCDSQLLAVASRMKKDALRLVHIPSMTVFANWPTSRTPLHYVHSLCFSPDSCFLAMGNAQGKVLLYRLHHYS